MARRAAAFYPGTMQTDPLFFFRIVSGIALAVCIIASFLVFKNAGSLFGIDPEVPSENGSARSYSKLLVVAVFVHAFIFFSAGLLFL